MKNSLTNILIIVSLAILLGGIGVVSAFFICVNDDYDIPWNRQTIQTPPKGTTTIPHIEFKYNLDDPTGDTIFIETRDGEIYSNVLFEKDWLLLDEPPTFDKEYTTDCAPTWAGAQSDSQIWDAPPTGNKVLDSAGIRFEHALAIDVRCYVLLNDGTLEVWYREDNAGSAGVFALVFFAPVFGLSGSFLGVFLGILIIRHKKKKARAQNSIDNSIPPVTPPQLDNKT